jgi:hypothetical protein
LKKNAAKEKSLSPLSLTSVRVLLLLVVAPLFLPQSRVWGFAAPHRAKSLLQVPQPSWEITTLGSTMRQPPLLLLLTAKTRRRICLNEIEKVSQVTAGPAKSAMMTSKNGKMQPTRPREKL